MMKNYKSLVAAALLSASALGFSGGASATTTTFEGYDRPGASNSRTETISISYLAGSFNLTGVLDPILSTIQERNTGLYFSGSLHNGLDSDALFTWAPESILNLSRFTFSASNLDAGTYTLRFNLTNGLFSGGFYTGNFTITPVPEPETNALMLVGLGLIGFIARRRYS